MAPPEQIATIVGNGAIDVGVVVSHAPKAGLLVESCWADELVLITPPKHPLACRERLGIHALIDYPFVARSGIVKELATGSRFSIRLVPPLLQPLTFLQRPLAPRAAQDLLDFTRRYVVAD